ncbi:MAG: hypothetical protein RIS54_1935 [Verrucomicrobiota bacterium]|jgi:hypothetical protein
MRPGAAADALRLVWALVYWNVRKTWFVLRRRGRMAPCQADSDDHRAPDHRCLAALHWESAERFQCRVCPLLQRKPAGWRCSVPADQVRPYWGRALLVLGALVLIPYLGGTVAVWGAMRFAGNAPEAWWRVAWPPAWSTIRLAQSEQFYGQSRAAFNAGDYAAAYRILAAARVRDPDNYEAALLMGQISMFQGSYAYADDLFAELMTKHPAHSEHTAQTYHDALLCLNRLDTLAAHSLTMVAVTRRTARCGCGR